MFVSYLVLIGNGDIKVGFEVGNCIDIDIYWEVFCIDLDC